jgi:RHS repeat-associated protein
MNRTVAVSQGHRATITLAALLALSILAVSKSSFADDRLWYVPQSYAGGPYPSGPQSVCLVPATFGSDPNDVAQRRSILHNSVTTEACFQTCRNPATHLYVTPVDENTVIATIRSNCTGWEYTYPIYRSAANPKQPVCDSNESAANPCNLATGAKVQTVVDFKDPNGDLTLARTYNSNSANLVPSLFGRNWHSNLDKRALGFAIPNTATRIRTMDAFFWRPGGTVFTFKYNQETSEWTADSDITAVVTQLVSPEGIHDGWILDLDGRTTEEYDSHGRLTRIRTSQGSALELSYGIDGLLSSVTDQRGRTLAFTTNGEQVTSVTLPDERQISFSYTAGVLGGVTYPDTTPGNPSDNHAVQYLYEVAGSPHLLTGIVDELGNRTSTWNYDAQGRVILSAHGDSESPVDRVEITYNEEDDTVILQQPLGKVSTLAFAEVVGVRRLVGSDGPCPSCNGEQVLARTFDSRGFPDQTTDLNGTLTDRDHDSRGRMIRRVDAANDLNGARRVTEVDWHPTFDVPTERRTLDASNALVAKVSWTYNSRGQALTVSRTDPTTLAARTSSFAYCEAADVATPNSTCPLLGQLKSIDGPRTDVADITVYRYRSADDLTGCGTAGGACHRRGDLHQIVAPGGLTTTYASYDLAGRPTRVLDANGVATDLEYNARGWLTARKVRGANDGTETDDAITRLDYDNVGQVTKVTQPDGAYLEFSYDAAHRLTGIEDNLGNTVTYQLDGAGNRISEETRDAANVLTHSLSRVYDQLGQLETLADALATPTDFTYDAAGQVDTVTDAFNRTMDNDYDPLGRLKRSIANVNGTGPERAETQFQYDALDNLTAVIDPKGLTTRYGYNGLGDLVGLDSPDTGSTTYTYDEAGNRRGQLDARGVQTGYLYDELNRLTQIDLSAPGQLLQFTYDTLPAVCPGSEAFPAGRLSQMSDPHGSAAYCYDRRGNVVRKVQSLAGIPAATVGYAYSTADRLTSITYPSGAVVTYQRDANGRITGVTAKPTATAAQVTLVSDVDYLPFGPASRMSFGNGRTLDRTYDANYGIAGISDSAVDGVDLDYTLDAVGNVTGLGERLTGGATASRTVDYDGLDRLTALRDGATVAQRFEYDATGNRTKKVSGGTATYAYPTDSHRLAKVGSVVRNHDAAGNMLNLSTTRSFTYDDQGRLTQYLANGVPSREYRHNARGERVTKIVVSNPASNVHYVYDEAGHLLGEYRPNGTRLKEYVWLDDTLVAVFSAHAGSNHQYVLTDHLGTPRAVVHPTSNAIVWRWNLTGSAFGDHLPQTNPDGDSTNYVFNLRYPGQYYDAETGLHYNYFRDYDPKTGRYMQSDPIGLAGGASTYAYALNAPMSYVDPTGEVAFLIPVVAIGGKMLWGAAQDAAWQVFVEGKSVNCLDWGDMAVAAGFELIPGAGTFRMGYKASKSIRASRELSRQAARARSAAKAARLEARATQRATDGARELGELGYWKASESFLGAIITPEDPNPPAGPCECGTQ